MISVETIPTIKFWKEGKDGALRIGDTRVSLDSVYHRYISGASAQEIQESFPSLRLSEVYAALAYILDNREEVDEYIRRGEIHAAKVEAIVKDKFGKRSSELKQKMLARNKARLNTVKP